MKIAKYKKRTKGRYSVYLDDGRELLLYEEVILKYELLIKKEIVDLDEINKANIEYDVYYTALNMIRTRIRSSNELRKLLIKKEYPEDLVDMTIDKLTNQGYLNDREYAKSYTNYQINNTNHGPIRIKKDLYDKDISNDIINEVIEEYDIDIQKEKINKIIKLKLTSNSNRSGMVLKSKIFNDLMSLGYEYSLIEECLSNYSFEVDKNVVKKEYDKLMKKYSSKLSGDLLKKKVREKLYLKGMVYEEE